MGYSMRNALVNIYSSQVVDTFTSSDKQALHELIAKEQELLALSADATALGALADDVEPLGALADDATALLALADDAEALGALADDAEALGALADDATALGALADDVEGILGNLEYSATEKNVGKWGEQDLYRKIFNVGATSVGIASYVNSGLSNVTIRKMYGITSPSVGAARPVPYFNITGGGDTRYLVCEYNYTNDQVIFNCNFASFADGEVYIVLEYTKNPPTPGPDTRDGDDTEPENKEVK